MRYAKPAGPKTRLPKKERPAWQQKIKPTFGRCGVCDNYGDRWPHRFGARVALSLRPDFDPNDLHTDNKGVVHWRPTA